MINELDLPLDQEIMLLACLLVLLLWVIRPRRSAQRSPDETGTPQTVETTSQDLNPEYGRYIQLGMRG